MHLTAAVQQLAGGMQGLRGTVQRLERRLCEFEARERLREAGRKPVYPVEFRSQFAEDALAWNLLGGQLEGFFIEVGAFDGYSYSVTYGLECVGWKGLLIEAIPERAQACAERRTQSRTVHAAMGRRGATGSTEFTVVADPYGGMLSYATTSPEHKASLQQHNYMKRTVSVPVTSMDELLKDHTGPIDLAVLDVEGGEVELLEGFDIEKRKPRLMIIEDNLRQEQTPLSKYMATKPYVLVGVQEVNRIYVHNESADILKRARSM
ncbi:MAG: FkbM family methyltransferase [Planctomycetota bacterium]|nr:FkbM family methyltransferase [Planctomycetota bacterium]